MRYYGSNWIICPYKASFTRNTHAHAIDHTQIFYNDKHADYSNRPLNHIRSARLIMTVKLTNETKDILSELNRERQQDQKLACMV